MFNYKAEDYEPSPILRAVQIFLLILIIAGVGLLLTQKIWVPKLVAYILKGEVLQAEDMIPETRPGKIDTGVEGIVTIGPLCPVMRENVPCPDKPFETALVISSNLPGKGGGIVVRTDKGGYFSQELVPGTYTVRAQSEVRMPSLAPVSFEVKSGQRTALNLQFDSGIR